MNRFFNLSENNTTVRREIAAGIKEVRGPVLLGIIITWVLGMICQMIGLYAPDVENGFYSLFPEKIVSLDFSALGYTFGQLCGHQPDLRQ